MLGLISELVMLLTLNLMYKYSGDFVNISLYLFILLVKKICSLFGKQWVTECNTGNGVFKTIGISEYFELQ